MLITKNLSDTLSEAIRLCHDSIDPERRVEEHGGWIVQKDDEFKFFFLRNDNAGTPQANVLFLANQQDVGKGPLTAMAKEGWKNYATFHTHPQFSVTPSSLDWNQMFQCCPYNFIYSPATLQLGVSHYLGRSDTDDGQKWEQNVFDVVYGAFVPAKRIRQVTL